MKRFINSPAFFVLILLVVMNFVRGGFSDPAEWLINKLIMLPGIVIGISFHEFAHGLASNALGDPTPKRQGRLTINPAAHIDPFGFVALLIAGFGWGVPVQIDPTYYKHRRGGQIIVALAGVTMNFILALVFSMVTSVILRSNAAWMTGDMGSIVIEMLTYIILINVILMIFNLLPIPPLDGFGIITEIFNLRKYNWYYTVYNNGFLILLVLVFMGVTDMVLTPGVNGVYGWLVNTIIY